MRARTLLTEAAAQTRLAGVEEGLSAAGRAPCRSQSVLDLDLDLTLIFLIDLDDCCCDGTCPDFDDIKHAQSVSASLEVSMSLDVRTLRLVCIASVLFNMHG